MFNSRRLSLIDKNQRGGLVSNLDKLEKEIGDPTFWNSPKLAKEKMKMEG